MRVASLLDFSEESNADNTICPVMQSEESYEYVKKFGKHPDSFRPRHPVTPRGEIVTVLSQWRNSKLLLTAVALCEKKNPSYLHLSERDRETYQKWYDLQRQHKEASYTFVWLYGKLCDLHRAHQKEDIWNACLDDAVHELYATWDIPLNDSEIAEMGGTSTAVEETF